MSESDLPDSCEGVGENLETLPKNSLFPPFRHRWRSHGKTGKGKQALSKGGSGGMTSLMRSLRHNVYYGDFRSSIIELPLANISAAGQ